MRRSYTVVLYVLMASIDNTALALLPALTPRIRADLGVSNQALGLVVGLNLVVVAVAALFWGYRSDQTDRRRLLMLGTLAWALPLGLVRFSTSYASLAGLILLAGLGLGCISTVGYSIITDLIPQRWRGLLLGIWGLTQGIGALAALMIVGLAPDSMSWREPFGLLAAVGASCSVLALWALSPHKGAADAALQSTWPDSATYSYAIQRGDLPFVIQKPTNRWLMLQGFLAQFTYGSLTWITALLTAKLVAEGLAVGRANGVAALLGVLFQLGGIVSVFWGWLGDRLQRHSPRARAVIAAYGFWAALPCYLVLFWTPLPLAGAIDTTPTAIVATQLGRNGWWWLALAGATCAVIAQATNAPNWFAMVAEANLPEHRGTAFSFVTLANNLGRAMGAFLVGATFDWLERGVAAPLNYALGLTIFQLFFVPAGLCFWLAARTAPADSAAVERTLRARAGSTSSTDEWPGNISAPAV